MHNKNVKQQNLIYCDSQTCPNFILFLSIQLRVIQFPYADIKWKRSIAVKRA